MNEPMVQALDAAAARDAQDALYQLLIDSVDSGASVGFIAPMTQAKARDFWDEVIAGVANGGRTLLVARNAEGRIVGSVQLLPAQKENQPHRADISKLLVHRDARRHGVGALLMRAAEAAALAAGRTVLVLDTATPEAERLYERAGWQRCGVIPDYALMPDGSLCATTVMYKRLTAERVTSRGP